MSLTGVALRRGIPAIPTPPRGESRHACAASAAILNLNRESWVNKRNDHATTKRPSASWRPFGVALRYCAICNPGDIACHERRQSGDSLAAEGDYGDSGNPLSLQAWGRSTPSPSRRRGGGTGVPDGSLKCLPCQCDWLHEASGDIVVTVPRCSASRIRQVPRTQPLCRLRLVEHAAQTEGVCQAIYRANSLKVAGPDRDARILSRWLLRLRS